MQEAPVSPAHDESLVTVRAPWHTAIPSGLRCLGRRGITNGANRVRCLTCKTDIIVAARHRLVPQA